MSYRWYSVFSKLCFICSVIFFVYAISAVFHLPINVSLNAFAGFIITMAFLSFILNFIAAFVLIVFLLKGIKEAAPVWIISFNIFTFFFQLFYFLLI